MDCDNDLFFSFILPVRVLRFRGLLAAAAQSDPGRGAAGEVLEGVAGATGAQLEELLQRSEDDESRVQELFSDLAKERTRAESAEAALAQACGREAFLKAKQPLVLRAAFGVAQQHGMGVHLAAQQESEQQQQRHAAELAALQRQHAAEVVRMGSFGFVISKFVGHVVAARGPPARKELYDHLISGMRAVGSMGRKFKSEMKDSLGDGCADEDGTEFGKFLVNLHRRSMPRLVHQQRLHAASLGGGASITTEDGRRLKSTWVNAEGMLVPYDFAADVAFHKVHAPELWAVLEAVLQTTGGKSELNSMKRYAQSCGGGRRKAERLYGGHSGGAQWSGCRWGLEKRRQRGRRFNSFAA